MPPMVELRPPASASMSSGALVEPTVWAMVPAMPIPSLASPDSCRGGEAGKGWRKGQGGVTSSRGAQSILLATRANASQPAPRRALRRHATKLMRNSCTARHGTAQRSAAQTPVPHLVCRLLRQASLLHKAAQLAHEALPLAGRLAGQAGHVCEAGGQASAGRQFRGSSRAAHSSRQRMRSCAMTRHALGQLSPLARGRPPQWQQGAHPG